MSFILNKLAKKLQNRKSSSSSPPSQIPSQLSPPTIDNSIKNRDDPTNDADDQSEVHNKKRRDFKWKRKLGSGSFGEVTLCDWLAHSPPIEVAVKVVDKTKVIRSKEEQEKGMSQLGTLSHPHLIKLHDWFESKEHYYLVFELAAGGELYDQVESRGKFREEEARFMIRDLLDAVIYFHTDRVVHRDLKLENIFLRSSDKFKEFPDSTQPAAIYHCLIADFGVCTFIPEEATQDAPLRLTNVCGSAGYIAPEIVEKTGYNYGVDVWSVGIIAFLLMGGRFPFKAVIAPEFVEQARKGAVFPVKTWKDVSDEAKDFIRDLLTFDPKTRPTAKMARAHKWIATTERTFTPAVPPAQLKTISSSEIPPTPIDSKTSNPPPEHQNESEEKQLSNKISEAETLTNEPESHASSTNSEENLGSPRERRVTIGGKEDRVH